MDFTIKLSVLFAVVVIFMRNSRRPELVDPRYCGAARRDRLPRWVSLDFVTFCLRTRTILDCKILSYIPFQATATHSTTFQHWRPQDPPLTQSHPHVNRACEHASSLKHIPSWTWFIQRRFPRRYFTRSSAHQREWHRETDEHACWFAGTTAFLNVIAITTCIDGHEAQERRTQKGERWPLPKR